MTLVQKGNPEQALRPSKWDPSLHIKKTKKKTRDKHNYRQTTKEHKEIYYKK